MQIKVKSHFVPTRYMYITWCFVGYSHFVILSLPCTRDLLSILLYIFCGNEVFCLRKFV